MRLSRRTHTRFVAVVALALAGSVLIVDPQATAGATKGLAIALVAVVLSVYGALVTPRKPRVNVVPLSQATLAGLLFLGLSALSLLWGTRAGLIDLALWISAMALAFALRGYALGLRLRILETTTAIVCGTSALWAIFERAFHRESTGGHGNPDWLGLTLALGLPICVGNLLRKERRVPATVLTLVVATGLYLSHSRTGWVAGSVASLAVLAAGRRNQVLAPRAASAALLAPSLTNHAGAFREAETARAWSGRLWIFERNAEVVRAHPVRGVGLGRYGFGYLEAQGSALSKLSTPEASRHFINATTAHNDYMHIACESGLAAALAFVWFLLRSALALFRQSLRGSLGAFGVIVAFSVCALGDSPLHLPAPVLLLTLAVSLAKDRGPAWARLPTAPARILRSLVPAFAIFAAAISAGNYASTRLRTRAALAGSSAQPRLLARATELDLTGDAELELGLYLLAQGGDAQNASAAERHLRTSSERLPNAGTFVALGNALAGQGKDTEAKAEYERAVALNPGSLKAHLNLAEIARRLGLRDFSKKHAEMARLIAPYHPKVLDLQDRLEADDARVLSEELERVDVDDDANGTR